MFVGFHSTMHATNRRCVLKGENQGRREGKQESDCDEHRAKVELIVVVVLATSLEDLALGLLLEKIVEISSFDLKTTQASNQLLILKICLKSTDLIQLGGFENIDNLCHSDKECLFRFAAPSAIHPPLCGLFSCAYCS